MYALERYKAAGWQRYAVCSRRWPLDRVIKSLPSTQKWRVVYTPETLDKQTDKKRAA